MRHLKKGTFFAVIFCGCFLMAWTQSIEIPRDTTYNVNKVYRQIHKDFPYATIAKDKTPSGVIDQRNIVYTILEGTTNGRRELRLDIFKPEKSGKYPAIIMIHGGGWRSGTKEMQIPMAQQLALRGFVTIPVEYQLSLEASYPAALYNIKSAIRWVKANAERIGIDTSKIAISGCSAGGHLAALVGLTNGRASYEGDHGNQGHSSEVSSIIDIDGVLDFMAPASLNLKRQVDSPDVAWLGGTFESYPLIWKDASPIFSATQSTAVPILFINSGFSRFHAGQDELIGMLKEWGIYHEVHQFNIKVHPFWLFHPWMDTTIGYMSDFLKKVYKKK